MFIRTKYLFVLFLYFFFNPYTVSSQTFDSTGLIFAAKDQLNEVPLASTPFSGDEFPNFVDLSSSMPPTGEQGIQASCVAWSTAYALKSYQENIEERISFLKDNKIDDDRIFSPSFIYNQLNNGRDGGISIISALDFISEKGCATLKDMPYNPADYLTLPTDAVKQNAQNYKISYWRKVDVSDIQEIKKQLNAGYPVIIGAEIDKDFKANGYNNDNNVPYIWNDYLSDTRIGHAMVAVGFSDRLQAFKIMNSWGEYWGNEGYCWISYNFFPNCIKEGYIAKDALNKKKLENITSEDEKIFLEGKYALDNDEYPEAILKLSEYLQKNPSDEAYNYLGLSYFKSKKFEEAFNMFDESIKLNPGNLEAYSNRGYLYLKSGDYNNAINDYSFVIEKEINSGLSYFYRGLAFLKSGRPEDAIRDLTTAISFKKDNQNIYYNRGLANFEIKKYKEATEDFSTAISINSNISQFYLKRGVAFYKDKHFEKAIDDYKKALEINPENFDANKELGLSYYKFYDYNNAIKFLSKAVNLKDDVICYYVRGDCYYNLKDYKSAVKDFEKSISLNPEISKTIGKKLKDSKTLSR